MFDMIIMDPMSGPKWKMACNKCHKVLHIFKDTFKVSLSENGCDDCGASLIDVTFHRNKSPLPDDKTEHTGCAFSDTILVPMVKFDMAKGRHPMFRRGPEGSGRKRGRGRGKRGRRGRGNPKDKVAQLDAFFV